jgi:ligand-binding sensor domain-containing protein
MRLLGLFLCLLSLPVYAQQPFLRNVWLSENRVPVKVNVLARDRQGYIVAGTDKGLYRYNGSVSKEIFSTVTQEVTALTLIGDVLWVGYKNGRLGKVVNDSVKQLVCKNYKGTAAVTDIQMDKDKTLYLATENGLVAVRNNIAVTYTTKDHLSDNFIYNLNILPDGRILAGTDLGISDIRMRKEGPEVKVISMADGLPDNIVRVIKNNPGTSLFWVGTQQRGGALYDIAARKNIGIKPNIPWFFGQVNDVLALSKNKTLTATDEGYILEAIIQPDDSLLARNFYFPNRKFNALLRDPAGNIWCGTNTGLVMLSYEYLAHMPLEKPYALSNVTAICCDRNNVLWLALKNDLYRIDLKAQQQTMQFATRFKDPVSSLYCDLENRVWAGTAGSGIWYKKPAAAKFEKIASEELSKESILSITGTRASLWIAGLNGVRELSYPDAEGGIAIRHTHNKNTGIGSDYIYQLYADRKGRVWMATDGAGVCMYDGLHYYTWENFKVPGDDVVYSITEDALGDIWAGTLKKNIYQYSRGLWTNRKQTNSPENNAGLSALQANGTGQVLALFQNRLDLWYPGNKAFRYFSNFSGMDIDSTSDVLNCVTRDTAGNIYMPFEDGVLMVKNEEHGFDIRPGIAIIRITNNSKDIVAGLKQFKPDENFISFYFDGISFTNPERLTYRYRLEGYSNNWIHTNEPVVTFPKLPSGKFTFRVQVSLNGNFDNAEQAEYSFEIAVPLWRRWWFIVLLSTAVLAIVALLIGQRDKRVKRMAQLQQDRILLEYEHLKSQVNPHFLFNSLNTLTNLIEENSGNAVVYTERLSDLYRNMLTYHDRSLIMLSEEWDILSNYLFIQQNRFGKALQVEGDLSEDLMRRKKIAPMALQLLVENAIKHNVVAMSTPLVIFITANEYEIVVRNRIVPKINKERESGIGLANIRNRYALLTSKPVSFGAIGEEWVVRLPLL